MRVPPALAGAITLSLAAHAAHAQVTPTLDLRRTTATARAGDTTHSLSASPATPFADFAPPDLDVDAAAASAASHAHASQSSFFHTANRQADFAARGSATASALSQGFDPGSAQASSSFYTAFHLAEPLTLTLSASLTRGNVSSAQLILQSSDNQTSYFLDASSPQPIELTATLPAGDYTLVAYASAAVALYPFADLADGCTFDLTGSIRPACPTDFNADGFLDFFDYDDFVACFESGACPPHSSADFNHDGFADFFDYDSFVESFEAGC
jgi:hypothetical protein